jgi:transcriptional regulator with XRE-family HTH domain
MNQVERRPIVEPKRMDRGPFGSRLKQLREGSRVSQSKLAERAGFDHSYVSRLESGARTPTREAVSQLAGALQLDGSAHDSLLAAAGFLPKEVSSLLSSEPEISEVLHLLHDDEVPGEVRELLRAQLRLLAEQVRYTVPARTASHAAA